jgi:hypothetical protein
LFRGDTSNYTELTPKISPEELVKKGGTMDNSLGTLFLGEYPGTFGESLEYSGSSRYLNGKSLDADGNWKWDKSATGKKSTTEEPTSYMMYLNKV